MINHPSRVQFGKSCEASALEFLQRQGFKLVAKNYRCAVGEIDLIVTKGKLLVFVEVRSVRNSSSIHPLESIQSKKLKRLRKTAEHFLLKNRFAEHDIRFDLISMVDQEIDHVENIVSETTS